MSIALLGTMLFLLLKQARPEFSFLISVVACLTGFFCIMDLFGPIKELIVRTENMSGLDSQIIKPLLKATGICILTEITATVCADSGNATIEKAIRYISSVYLAWLSVPLINELLNMITSIAEEI